MLIGFDASRINIGVKTGIENYSTKLLHWLKKMTTKINIYYTHQMTTILSFWIYRPISISKNLLFLSSGLSFAWLGVCSFVNKNRTLSLFLLTQYHSSLFYSTEESKRLLLFMMSLSNIFLQVILS